MTNLRKLLYKTVKSVHILKTKCGLCSKLAYCKGRPYVYWCPEKEEWFDDYVPLGFGNNCDKFDPKSGEIRVELEKIEKLLKEEVKVRQL